MTKLNKRQEKSSILPASENNKLIWKLFKPNKPKATGQLSFLEVKILGWLTTVGYTLQNTLLDHTLHSKLASVFTRTPTKFKFST